MISSEQSNQILTDVRSNSIPWLESKSEHGFITSEEFAALDCKHEWLIDRCLVKGEPMVIGGPKKTLKTSVTIDLAISLAIGPTGKFLNRFSVERGNRVGIISGESGQATLKKLALKVCQAKRVKLHDLNIFWRFDMPALTNGSVQDVIAGFIRENKIDVLICDPMYLALMGGDDVLNPANVMQMGAALRKCCDGSLREGCTPILLHHTKKMGMKDQYRPLDLDDLSQAGFAEFARQWLLLSRRSAYEDGSGKHELWMRVGGSAGHSALWGLHVNEGAAGTIEGERIWYVDLKSAKEVKEEKAEDAQLEKELQIEKKINKVVQFLEFHPDGETKSKIRDGAGVNTDNLEPILKRLLERGQIKVAKVKKRNKSYSGYQLVAPKAVDPVNPDTESD